MSRWNDPYWDDEEPPEEPERCECCAVYDGQKHRDWCSHAPMSWGRMWSRAYFYTFSIYRIHMALKRLVSRFWPKKRQPPIDDDIPF